MANAILAVAAAGLLVGASADRPRLDDLGWLSGQWSSSDGENWAEELWSAPHGGQMIGVSHSGRGASVEQWEFLRIELDSNGVPVYWASPRGRPPVGFRLARADGDAFVFENASHDYPQRITYRRLGQTLTATISAIDGGNAMSWTLERR